MRRLSLRRARAAAADPGPAAATPPARTACIERIGPVSLDELDALVVRRVAEREQRSRWRTAAISAQASARSAEVLAWPVGRPCPLGRLREAWVTHRYGLAMVADSGTAVAGASSPALRALVGRATALYETYAEQRPPGWPTSGAAALSVLAQQRRAERFGGDVARLLGLAKAMRALALEHDPERLARARARAEARRAPSTLRFSFRVPVRRETSERLRQRVRDLVLLAGADPAAWPSAELALCHLPALRADQAAAPALLGRDRLEELDGIGARAARYRAELARDLWQLPHGFPQPTRDDDLSQPKEPAPR